MDIRLVEGFFSGVVGFVTQGRNMIEGRSCQNMTKGSTIKKRDRQTDLDSWTDGCALNQLLQNYLLTGALNTDLTPTDLTD